MIHNSNYAYMGLPCDSHAKVTSFDGDLEGKVTVAVNKYTTIDCTGDIEQTFHTFEGVEPVNMTTTYFEAELLKLPEWSEWSLCE